MLLVPIFMRNKLTTQNLVVVYTQLSNNRYNTSSTYSNNNFNSIHGNNISTYSNITCICKNKDAAEAISILLRDPKRVKNCPKAIARLQMYPFLKIEQRRKKLSVFQYTKAGNQLLIRNLWQD